MKALNLLNYTFIFLLIILFSSAKPRKFPEFSNIDFNGNKVSNINFAGKTTIVVMGHLGCPAFMQLLSDFQTNAIDTSFQLIVFLENTHFQLIEFNSEQESLWAITRKHFKLNPLEGIFIPECINDKTVNKNGQYIIQSQCRKLSRRLRTKTSPTSYLVKPDGLIHAKFEGYFMGKGATERLENYFTKLGRSS